MGTTYVEKGMASISLLCVAVLFWFSNLAAAQPEQQAQPTTAPHSQLPLKAAIVLTQEFCESNSHTGSYWKLGKTIYFTGRLFCRGIEPALKPTFISLTRVSDASLAGDAQVVLIPRFIDVKEKMHMASSDLILSYEWTAKDSSGKTVWTEIIEEQAHGHKINKLLTQSMNAVFSESANKMSASPGLRKLAEGF